ncbi:MAG: hypothetical protein QOI36_1502 [Pseudonocardiales bacterium]|jgi:transposase|nr:hypothetical protein [Pseudonocardia sp.]MDT7650096.1 hypothetical protein [Pseudonocardiales bacterium]
MAEPVRACRLTDDEGRRLTQIVRRGKHGSIRTRRAMIVMASSSGTPVPAIARLVAADEDTVRDVIHAFNERGLAALDPEWAGGRPRLISDEDIRFIIATATTRPIWHVLAETTAYRDLGSDYFTRRIDNPEARKRRLIHELEALGHKVTIEPNAA